MNIKRVLSSILSKAADTAISQNTASVVYMGIEDMPESIKKTR